MNFKGLFMSCNSDDIFVESFVSKQHENVYVIELNL